MRLIVNGEPGDHAAETLAHLVEQLDLSDAVVATALNGTFVPKRRRDGAVLHDDDRIEIVAPMQGG